MTRTTSTVTVDDIRATVTRRTAKSVTFILNDDIESRVRIAAVADGYAVSISGYRIAWHYWATDMIAYVARRYFTQDDILTADAYQAVRGMVKHFTFPDPPASPEGTE